jgi:hypothetical protein
VRTLDQLTNLTHLAIAGCAHQPAMALASLSRLRSLWWLVNYSSDLPPEHTLPEGWLTNLRQLAAPLWCMASSQAAVDTMPQLPQLRSLVIPEGMGYERRLRWAAQHPDLEEVHLEISNKHLGTLLPVILELQRCRPGLRIERHTDLTQLPQFSAVN